MNLKSIKFPGLEGEYTIPQTAADVGAISKDAPVIYAYDEEHTTESAPLNAETLGGIPAEEYATKQYVNSIGGSGSGGVVLSWNDLTDKPFGEESCNEMIFDDIVSFYFDESEDVHWSDYFAGEASLELGSTYTVVWDGVEYKNLVCFDYLECETIGATDDELYDGTASLPFQVYFDGESLSSGTTDSGEEHTIKIIKTVSIHKLDDNYISDTIARSKDIPYVPFARELVTSFEWDGDITGKELINIGDFKYQNGLYAKPYLCKISDDTEYFHYEHHGLDVTYFYVEEQYEMAFQDCVKCQVYNKETYRTDTYFYQQPGRAYDGGLEYCHAIFITDTVETSWGITLTPGFYVKCYLDDNNNVLGYCKNASIYYCWELPDVYLNRSAYIPTPRFDRFYLRSSTEGSTKVFRIEVDDSGTLSVTESF